MKSDNSTEHVPRLVGGLSPAFMLGVQSRRVPRVMGFLLMALCLTGLLGGAQQTPQNPPNGQPAPPRQGSQKPAQTTNPPPAKPLSKIAPNHVVPQVKQQINQLPQVGQKISQPFKRILPGGNGTGNKPATGQTAQAATQVSQVPGGNRSGQKPVLGVNPSRTSASLGSRPGGFKLPPNARSVPTPGGGARVIHPDGRQWVVDNNNHVRSFTRPGLEANFNSEGRLSTVHVVRPNSNMVVARTRRGERETVALRPGGVIVMTHGKGRGYVQRPMAGRAGYFERTSLVNGQPSAHVYRAYRYRGVVYFRYVPAHYYQPRFYAWAQNPWPRAAAYRWQSSGPGLTSYPTYFAPAPSYPSASLWLTDFVMAANLKTAHQDHQEFEQSQPNPAPTNESSPDTAPVTPEVKEKISQEVQMQLADEQAASGQPGGQGTPVNGQAPPPVLSPNERTFVVSQTLDVGAADAACTLAPGDVIERTGDMMPDNKVAVNVLASKPGDCRANSSTQVEVGTLQEMHNQMHEQIDDGLATLADSEGQLGVPPGPPAGPRPSPEGTTQPDRDVATVLAQQQSDADAAEGAATDGENAVAAS